MNDTIFALSSGALPAAIAVVRLSGDGAHAAAGRLCGTLPPPRQMALRPLRDPSGDLIDHALVVVFTGPASATGEDMVELHCHGGRAVVARLLDELRREPGLREAEPGEFTRRALVNGRLDLTEAEGLGDLLGAETEWQRRAALRNAGGALRLQVEAWRGRLVTLAARAEAAIDYVDEDETEVDNSTLATEAAVLAAEWKDWLAAPRADVLNEGLRIVLGGPPNSGKSSLFNALLDCERAIVTAVPGTTRDLIEARVNWNGLPLSLIDTAGLCDSDDVVEAIGIAKARQALAESDILVWLGNASDAPSHDALVTIHARSDIRTDLPPRGRIAVSARTGEGVVALKEAIYSKARDLLPPMDRATLNRRQAAVLEDAVGWLEGVEGSDALLTAEAVRGALFAVDRLSGRRGIEDVIDEIFSRFCLGK